MNKNISVYVSERTRRKLRAISKIHGVSMANAAEIAINTHFAMDSKKDQLLEAERLLEELDGMEQA